MAYASRSDGHAELTGSKTSVLSRGGTLGLPKLDLRHRLRMVRQWLLPCLLPRAAHGRTAGRPRSRPASGEPRPLSILQGAEDHLRPRATVGWALDAWWTTCITAATRRTLTYAEIQALSRTTVLRMDAGRIADSRPPTALRAAVAAQSSALAGARRRATSVTWPELLRRRSSRLDAIDGARR